MRQLFLWHRWLGIGLCLFMALWFISGIVMLYVGYPKLTPTEHLQSLPELNTSSQYIDVDTAQLATGQSLAPNSIRLSSIADQPFYLFKYPNLATIAINAFSGERVQSVNKQQAVKSARAFYQGSDADYIKLIDKDAWTQSRGLDDERPFHVVKIHDEQHRLLYISAQNGNVIRDVTFNERTWGWIGAWLHWIYPIRSLPLWADIIIYLSLFATVMSVIGQFLGIKRWRFSATYRSGSHSPYRKGFARWHHIAGLLFGFILIAWIFSGLMSMNPWKTLANQSQLPVQNYKQGELNNINSPWSISTLLNQLSGSGFNAKEIAWHKVNGQFWLTAYNETNQSRVINLSAALDIKHQIPLPSLLSGLQTITPNDKLTYQWVNEYDFYYFHREPQSMYGSRVRPLPVLRVMFSDSANTWLHIDPYSGTILDNIDQRRRVSRWLFNLLHSWDWHVLLEKPLVRELLMIFFSLGGLLISISGIVMGWRRLRFKLAK